MILKKGFNPKDFVRCGRKIVGAALNYNTVLATRNIPAPKTPMMFLKPTSSYITQGQMIEIPPDFEVHHEVELGVIIGHTCKGVNASEAHQYVGGYCLALDLTAVNAMKVARSEGLSWMMGKGFDTACPVSVGVQPACIPCPSATRLWCAVNDEVRQDCSTKDMIFSVEEQIAFVSQYMTLEPYDLILTGSPDGTGPITSGDKITAGLGDILSVEFYVR